MTRIEKEWKYANFVKNTSLALIFISILMFLFVGIIVLDLRELEKERNTNIVVHEEVLDKVSDTVIGKFVFKFDSLISSAVKQSPASASVIGIFLFILSPVFFLLGVILLICAVSIGTYVSKLEKWINETEPIRSRISNMKRLSILSDENMRREIQENTNWEGISVPVVQCDLISIREEIAEKNKHNSAALRNKAEPNRPKIYDLCKKILCQNEKICL